MIIIVEFEGRLKGNSSFEVVISRCFLERFFSGVEIVDVGLVMFGVMEVYNFS